MIDLSIKFCTGNTPAWVLIIKYLQFIKTRSSADYYLTNCVNISLFSVLIFNKRETLTSAALMGYQ